MSKKNILIISLYYPPTQSIASNRIYSFAKYLDKKKYNVFIHTLHNNSPYSNDLDQVHISRSYNNTFLKPFLLEHRTNIIIHYSKVIYNILIKKIVKNIYQKWIDASYTLLEEKIKAEKIDLIISSFAPDASHILALKLKKRFPKLKWIADMRDEMSKSPYIDIKTKKQYQAIEQQIFSYADALTSVSKPILNGFKDVCNNNRLLFTEIRNGYDFPLKKEKLFFNNIFTITYTGNFYGDINPSNFFIALEMFIKEFSHINMRVQLVGVKIHFPIPKSIIDIIHIKPSVSHTEAITIMKRSDALLLIHPSNGRKGVFTGKLFEYLGVLKPIIALVDEQDVAAQLIKDANAGYVADNSDIFKIKNNLILLYDEYKTKKNRVYNLDLIHLHHRKEQVKRLETLIGEVIYE